MQLDTLLTFSPRTIVQASYEQTGRGVLRPEDFDGYEWTRESVPANLIEGRAEDPDCETLVVVRQGERYRLWSGRISGESVLAWVGKSITESGLPKVSIVDENICTTTCNCSIIKTAQRGTKNAILESVCGLKKTKENPPNGPTKISLRTKNDSSGSWVQSGTNGQLPSFVVVSVSTPQEIKKEIHNKLWRVSPETEKLFNAWVDSPNVKDVKQCGSWGKTSGLVRVRVDDSPYRLIFVAEVFDDWLYLNELRSVAHKAIHSYKQICHESVEADAKQDIKQKWAGKSSYLYFPVTILGDPDHHITIKFFADTPVTPEQIRETLKGVSTQPPSLSEIQWAPVEFTNKEGAKIRVLELQKYPARLAALHYKLETLRPDDYPDYRPHVTVSDDLWEKVRDQKLAPGDLKFHAGPMTFDDHGKVQVVADVSTAKSKLENFPKVPGSILEYIRGTESAPKTSDPEVRAYKKALYPLLKEKFPSGYVTVYRTFPYAAEIDWDGNVNPTELALSYSDSKSFAISLAKERRKDVDPSEWVYVIRVKLPIDQIYFHHAFDPVGKEHPLEREVIAMAEGAETKIILELPPDGEGDGVTAASGSGDVTVKTPEGEASGELEYLTVPLYEDDTNLVLDWFKHMAGDEALGEELAQTHSDVAILHLIMVKTTERGKGAGTRLLKSWLDAAKKQGADLAVLKADDTYGVPIPDLMRWYGSMGFKQAGKNPHVMIFPLKPQKKKGKSKSTAAGTQNNFNLSEAGSWGKFSNGADCLKNRHPQNKIVQSFQGFNSGTKAATIATGKEALCLGQKANGTSASAENLIKNSVDVSSPDWKVPKLGSTHFGTFQKRANSISRSTEPQRIVSTSPALKLSWLVSKETSLRRLDEFFQPILVESGYSPKIEKTWNLYRTWINQPGPEGFKFIGSDFTEARLSLGYGGFRAGVWLDPSSVQSEYGVMGMVFVADHDYLLLKKKLQEIKSSGNSIEYSHHSDGQELHIEAFDGDRRVGMLEVAPSASQPGKLYPLGVKVDPQYRRQGIATEMYRLAEELTGKKIVSGNSHSPEGLAFRKAWDALKSSSNVQSDLESWDTGKWVHYSKHPDMKLNPQPGHQDPVGIYLFPSNFKPEGNWFKFPYRFNVNVSTQNTLDLGKLTEAQSVKLYEDLVPPGKRGLTPQDFRRTNHADILWHGLQSYFILISGAPGRAAWNQALQGLGYDSVFDDTGSIFANEVQMLVLDPRKVKVVSREEQKSTGFEEVKQVAQWLADYLKPHGTVQVTGPTRQRPMYGQPQPTLQSDVKVTSGEHYLDWQISTRFHERRDAVPTEINVHLRGGARSIRNNRSVGESLSWNKRPWDFSDLQREVDLAVQAEFGETEKVNSCTPCASWQDQMPGGLADKKLPQDFDPEALRQGTEVEREHTADPKIAQEIAMDHLEEDPAYYEKLKSIEASRVESATVDFNQAHAIVKECLGSFFSGLNLPYPVLKTTNAFSNQTLGHCARKRGERTSRITLHRSVFQDPKLLEQVLVHELVHHAQYFTDPEFVAFFTPREDGTYRHSRTLNLEGHGESFKKWADKINAVKGKGFVSEKTDTAVKPEEKEFFLLIERRNDLFAYNSFHRFGPTTKGEIERREKAYQAKLFKTKNRNFLGRESMKPYGGAYIPKHPEAQKMLREIYEQGKVVTSEAIESEMPEQVSVSASEPKPNKPFLPEQLVMIDCEMTGVQPKRDDLLQIAMLKLELQGNQYVEQGEPLLVYLNNPAQPTREFHKKFLSHVFKACNESTVTPEQAGQQIVNWLGDWAGKATPCGECVATDMSFLVEKGLITTSDFDQDDKPVPGTFHFELFDLNPLKSVLRQQAGHKFEVPGIDQENIHDALVDCRNQLLELNHYLELFLEPKVNSGFNLSINHSSEDHDSGIKDIVWENSKNSFPDLKSKSIEASWKASDRTSSKLSPALGRITTTGSWTKSNVVYLLNKPGLKAAIHSHFRQKSKDSDAKLFFDWVENLTASSLEQRGVWQKDFGFVRLKLEGSPDRILFYGENFGGVLYLQDFVIFDDHDYDKAERSLVDKLQSSLQTPQGGVNVIAPESFLSESRRLRINEFSAQALRVKNFQAFQELLSRVLVELQLTEPYRRPVAEMLNAMRVQSGLGAL